MKFHENSSPPKWKTVELFSFYNVSNFVNSKLKTDPEEKYEKV